MRLSIAIPIYNFAEFISETIESIVNQKHGEEVEIVVTDGGSTDNTPEVLRRLCVKYHNIKYNRLDRKGGIDKDMALAVEATSGDYVWLFSGDDTLTDGALAFVLSQISGGDDVYLCRHAECTKWMQKLFDYPILDSDEPQLFNLANSVSRQQYFRKALNSEAFFSFCSGLVIRRATWDRVDFDPRYDGSCWGHSARLFAATDERFTVNFSGRVLLNRRADNDSFSHNGLVERCRLQVEGFHAIINAKFGPKSLEAREMRRAIRNEFPPKMTLVLKYVCHLRPDIESRKLLDRVVALAYRDLSLRCMIVRCVYALTPNWLIWHAHRDTCWHYRYPEEHRKQQKRLEKDFQDKKIEFRQ